MTSGFIYSDDNKRYYTHNYYLRHKYGKKVFKVPINLGLSCPNRDGTKGVGGCTFCSGNLSGDFAGNPADSVEKQFEAVKAVLHKKWSDAYYIPYFQAGSNTYAPLERLVPAFEKAVSFENAVGINIATRADCITDECADYLKTLSQKTDLEVELGLQTANDKTAARINRCHSLKDFIAGYEKLKSRGIDVCIHIINGLPGETGEDMLDTARTVARLSPHSVKIHLLHIIKGTKLCDEFLRGDFSEMSMRDYVNIVCDQLEILPKNTVIARVTGDGKRETLVAPLWSLKKFCVMNEIDKEMLARGAFQGDRSEV